MMGVSGGARAGGGEGEGMAGWGGGRPRGRGMARWVAGRALPPVVFVMFVVLVLAASCSPADPLPDRESAAASPAASAMSTPTMSAPAGSGGASVEPTNVGPPSVGPGRFAFGTPASPTRIALWDIDVRPDGVGLPPGRGTVAEGATVFTSRCVACHGPTGSEGPFDMLVGGEPWGSREAPRRKTIGNYWPYATTLYDYIRRAMPQDAPGSLSADETYAVIAWLLARNGIVHDDVVMDAASLPAVVMPAHGRFVPDDRRGGAEVR